VEPGALIVKDSLRGQCKQAVAFFHIHPSVSVVCEGQLVVLNLPSGQRCEVTVIGGSAVLDDSTWHPEFGLSQPNKRIAVTFLAPTIETTFSY
jgi:uncharacterized heparinase superfamily protein